MTKDADGPPTLPAGLEAVRTESGLEYFEVETGAGAAVGLGKPVRVRYCAWLTSGWRVEASPEEGLEFTPGDETVIPALEEGVLGMKPGGRRRLIAPSDLAYGPGGKGEQIPPYATLIVDLEIVPG
jgi:FKBP-type peptidyl-prolyl cis-trans isomerase